MLSLSDIKIKEGIDEAISIYRFLRRYIPAIQSLQRGRSDCDIVAWKRMSSSHVLFGRAEVTFAHTSRADEVRELLIY